MIGPTDSAKTGNDKTAMMVSDQPHSWLHLPMCWGFSKQNKLNLTWIESFPYKDAKGEYVFFTDFDGHHEDPKVKKTISAMEEHLRFRFTFSVHFPIARACG